MKTGRPRLYIPPEQHPLPTVIKKVKVKKRAKKEVVVVPPKKPPKPKPPKPPLPPVSLSLLEWKRRQQWTPSGKDKAMEHIMEKCDEEGIIKVPRDLEKSGIEMNVPAWANVNPLKDMTRQPPVNDPPRKRHSSKTYAKWSLRLVNFLNSSGRAWARHEFFYSDVDRPW